MNENIDFNELRKQQLTGISGWLVVFIVYFILVKPFMTFMSLSTGNSYDHVYAASGAPKILTLLNGTIAITGILALITGILLLMKSKDGVSLATIYVKLLGIMSAMLVILPTIFAGRSRMQGDMITDGAVAAVIIFLTEILPIYLYFKKSIRVKLTYGLLEPEKK